MEIVLVRHGQSEANAGLTDFLDSSLTPLGRLQAEFTAEALRPTGLTRAYVSPLRRTLQTIQPICAATDLRAEVNAEVCEYFNAAWPGYKTFPGLSPEQIRVEYPFTFAGETFPINEAWWPQELENDAIIYARCIRVRDTLLRLYAETDDKILIVSHAETVGRLTEAFLHLPPDPIDPPWSDNCGITVLRISAGGKMPAALLKQNDTAHLVSLPQMRLDKALVMRGLSRSRAEAQEMVDDGAVTVNGRIALKPSEAVGVEAVVTISDSGPRWVSRGAIKLDAALSHFGIDVSGICALDVGASTGGFTECLLRRGAANVHSLDVGHGQMVPALAADPRVIVYEGVNARFLTPSDFPHPFPLIVADLSFISLTLVIPALATLMTSEGDLLCLVKPQFEVGAGNLNSGGIVRDPNLREQALARVVACARDNGLTEAGWMTSPITGTNGNVEFLVWLKSSAGRSDKRAE